MVTNENGSSDSSGQIDLDRLIGELETEAARRRAEPGYPHDADARLHFELARRAPSPPGSASLSAIVDRVEEVAATGGAATSEADASGSRRHDRQAVREQLRQIDGRVTSLGLAAAGALHAVTDRLEQLEEQVRLLGPRSYDSAPSSSTPDSGDALAQWRTRLAEALPLGERVLYAQSEADEVVAHLRAAGVDAYGITTTGPEDRPGPDVRFGDLLTHLDAVPDDALGAVVLAGGPEQMSAGALGPLVGALGRVTKSVVVVSEAPWWWRLRLGAVNADLAPRRPLDPDTWLHALHGVAMEGTAQYDPAGRSYRVVVRARA
jgi:hypothetical protein